MFLVTCGVTEKPFTISADDQKMKHEWMLAIKKVGVALWVWLVNDILSPLGNCFSPAR